MADIVDAATRSRMMSGIRGTHTKPEQFVRKLLHRIGYRFRLHVKGLPGKPDIVLNRYKAIIMVNGCFWHGHNCSYFKLPSTRTDFWFKKITSNQKNDVLTNQKLLAAGWRVATVWECALRGKTRMDDERFGNLLTRWLNGSARTLEVRGQKMD